MRVISNDAGLIFEEQFLYLIAEQCAENNGLMELDDDSRWHRTVSYSLYLGLGVALFHSPVADKFKVMMTTRNDTDRGLVSGFIEDNVRHTKDKGVLWNQSVDSICSHLGIDLPQSPNLHTATDKLMRSCIWLGFSFGIRFRYINKGFAQRLFMDAEVEKIQCGTRKLARRVEQMISFIYENGLVEQQRDIPEQDKPLYEIDIHEMSPEFYSCWSLAGCHLNDQVQGGIQSWLRAHPYPPTLEHMSFRLGNQLFFIRVIDVEGRVHGPGSIEGLFAVADGNGGHACLMPMKKQLLSGEWQPAEPGWGLVDADNHAQIDPFVLVSDENIEMTDWEVHDMGVQVVRNYLEEQGFELMSWNSNPEVNPSVWFKGRSGQPEWVVVRAARYPEPEPSVPPIWDRISAGCSKTSLTGYFATVSLRSPHQAAGEDAIPLWRGYAMDVNFKGLQEIA